MKHTRLLLSLMFPVLLLGVLFSHRENTHELTGLAAQMVTAMQNRDVAAASRLVCLPLRLQIPTSRRTFQRRFLTCPTG